MTSRMKILLITIRFHTVHEKIVQELTNMGYEVTFLEVPIPARLQRASSQMRLVGCFRDKKAEKNAIKELSNTHFDYCLALGTFFYSNKLLSALKETNPHIKTVLALWDSLAGWDFSYALSWFDKKYSFDPQDCAKHKELMYHPDFFLDNTPIFAEELKYDLCHIGTLHQLTGKRLEILLQLKQQADNLGLKSYITLFHKEKRDSLKSRVKYFLRKISSKKIRQFERRVAQVKQTSTIITDQYLSMEECFFIEKHSKCIVDIPTDVQSGYPIRTINTIASGQKLITTNDHIKKEPFYNENNICVIDERAPILDVIFLSKPTEKINIDQLSLKRWLKRLIEE